MELFSLPPRLSPLLSFSHTLFFPPPLFLIVLVSPPFPPHPPCLKAGGDEPRVMQKKKKKKEFLRNGRSEISGKGAKRTGRGSHLC